MPLRVRVILQLQPELHRLLASMLRLEPVVRCSPSHLVLGVAWRHVALLYARRLLLPIVFVVQPALFSRAVLFSFALLPAAAQLSLPFATLLALAQGHPVHLLSVVFARLC